MDECQRWREHFARWLVQQIGLAQVTGPGIPDRTWQPVEVTPEDALALFAKLYPDAGRWSEALLADARNFLAKYGTREPVTTFSFSKDRWEEQKAAEREALEVEHEIVVTCNGKPFAILAEADEGAFEERLKVLRRARAHAVLDRIQARTKERGLDRLTMEEIDAGIARARGARGGAGDESAVQRRPARKPRMPRGIRPALRARPREARL